MSMKNVPGNGISKKKLPLHTVGFSLLLSERHHRVPYTAASGYIIRVDKRNERIKRKKNTKENKEEKKKKRGGGGIVFQESFVHYTLGPAAL